jgi:hypothetical protein
VLHHAALVVSAVGRSFAPRQPGFRHAALAWNPEERALAGANVQASTRGRVHASVAMEPAALLLRAESGEVPLLTAILAGRSLADVQHDLRTALADAGLDAARLTLRLPADLPDGPLHTREPMVIDAAAAAELGRWFGLASDLLEDAAAAHESGLPVPCWPDHFDLAVLTAPAGAVSSPGHAARPDAAVTLGFSPGDGSIPEPYFYVTPWPVPPAGTILPKAPAGGRWQTDGWMGLALTATTIIAADASADLAAAFLDGGYAIARDLVLAA